MELSPAYDPTAASVSLAAGIAFEQFCLLAESRALHKGENRKQLLNDPPVNRFCDDIVSLFADCKKASPTLSPSLLFYCGTEGCFQSRASKATCITAKPSFCRFSRAEPSEERCFICRPLVLTETWSCSRNTNAPG